MGRQRTSRALAFALVVLGLLVSGVAPPASAAVRHDDRSARLLAELWRVTLTTPVDEVAVERLPEVKVDDGGHVYLCARVNGSIAPFTGSATHMQCRARPGQPLLLVGTSYEWSTAELPGYTIDQLRAKAEADLDASAVPQVLLDGHALPLERVVTRPTRVKEVVEPNLIAVVGGSTVFVAAAWLVVVPAPPGRHTVEFRPAPGVVGTVEIDARPHPVHHRAHHR